MLVDAAQSAGAQVLQPASARLTADEVLRQRGDMVVEVRIDRTVQAMNARLIVGADGVGSAIARAAGLADDVRIGRKYGFSFDMAVAQSAEISDSGIEMFVDGGGYLGMILQSARTAHCAGLLESHRGRGSRNPFEFVQNLARRFTTLQRLGLDHARRETVDRFVATGPLPWRPRAIANQRVALIGDAGGYIEPFTGEGMSWALQSAAILVDTVRHSPPGEWTGTHAQRYRREWIRQIARRQRGCRALAFALARPRVFSTMLAAGRSHPSLPRRLVQWMHA